MTNRIYLSISQWMKMRIYWLIGFFFSFTFYKVLLQLGFFRGMCYKLITVWIEYAITEIELLFTNSLKIIL